MLFALNAHILSANNTRDKCVDLGIIMFSSKYQVEKQPKNHTKFETSKSVRKLSTFQNGVSQ